MCGMFGVFNVQKAAELTVIGLHSNQHRAIDYAGIVSSDGSKFYRKTGRGLARQVFTKENIDFLHGNSALGHIRYPTVTDDETLDNVQPLFGVYHRAPIALSHNGNLTNLKELAKLIPSSMLKTSMDTEYILRLLQMHDSGEIEKDLMVILNMLEGSFALGILLPDRLLVISDKQGNRPLSIGMVNGGYCISSETCAFSNVEGHYLCDVEPGTIVSITSDAVQVKCFANPNEKKCRFEGIYYSHPSSTVFKENVSKLRMDIGRKLEELFPALGADIVTPIPDSSNFIAMGYGESGRSGKYLPVVIRSHYVGRTFIAATQSKRDSDVAQKFNFSSQLIEGKGIVVIDDSIVRGTTIPKIVSKLRKLGAKTIHVRIGSPPFVHPCRYGINTPTQEELIAGRLTPAEIRRQVGADSLEFLPLEVLKEISPGSEKFCFACMSGEYW